MNYDQRSVGTEDNMVEHSIQGWVRAPSRLECWSGWGGRSKGIEPLSRTQHWARHILF